MKLYILRFPWVLTSAYKLCLSLSYSTLWTYLSSKNLSTIKYVHFIEEMGLLSLKIMDKRNIKYSFFFTLQCTTAFSFLLVCQLQVLCRLHRQYQHHQVCPLRQGNLVLKLTIMAFIAIRICFNESICRGIISFWTFIVGKTSLCKLWLSFNFT